MICEHSIGSQFSELLTDSPNLKFSCRALLASTEVPIQSLACVEESAHESDDSLLWHLIDYIDAVLESKFIRLSFCPLIH